MTWTWNGFFCLTKLSVTLNRNCSVRNHSQFSAFGNATSVLYIIWWSRACAKQVCLDGIILDTRILICSNKFNRNNTRVQEEKNTLISELKVIGFIFRFIKDLANHIRFYTSNKLQSIFQASSSRREFDRCWL